MTVGMGPWPFDRLLEAVRPLCDSADVFAQTGASALNAVSHGFVPQPG